MSSLPEWIESARETVDEAARSRDVADKNESATAARDLLASESSNLASLSIAVSIGRRQGWIEPPSPQSAAVVRSALEGVVTKGALRRDVNQLQKSLPTYVNQLKAEVERAWKQHVQDRVGRIDDLDALIRLLAALPGQSSQRVQLEKLRKPLLDLTKGIPTETSAATLTATATQFDTSFSRAFGNEDVRQFLLACSRVGAKLDQMTANVADWLAQTGADQLLRIRLGQAD